MISLERPSRFLRSPKFAMIELKEIGSTNVELGFWGLRRESAQEYRKRNLGLWDQLETLIAIDVAVNLQFSLSHTLSLHLFSVWVRRCLSNMEEPTWRTRVAANFASSHCRELKMDLKSSPLPPPRRWLWTFIVSSGQSACVSLNWRRDQKRQRKKA